MPYPWVPRERLNAADLNAILAKIMNEAADLADQNGAAAGALAGAEAGAIAGEEAGQEAGESAGTAAGAIAGAAAAQPVIAGAEAAAATATDRAAAAVASASQADASRALAVQAALDAIFTISYVEAITSRTDFLFAFADRYNQVRAWIAPDGTLHSTLPEGTDPTAGILDGITALKDAGGIETITFPGAGVVSLADGSLQVSASTRDDFAFAMVGDYNEILWARLPNGQSTDASGSTVPTDPTTFSTSEIAQVNARALGRSASRAARINLEAVNPDADYNIVIWTGQSLSDGQEGWPALTTATQEALDLYMLGSSVYPQGLSSPAWVPIGASALAPLKANVRDSGTGLLSDAAVAALAPGSNNRGENPAIAAAIVARRMWLDARGLKNDATKKWVVGACGVSGQTLAALSRGASPDLFGRMVDFVTRVKAIATGEGKTCKVVMVGWMQGEADTIADSKAVHLAKLVQYVADINQYVCTAITGQDRPPVFVTYQTWGNNMDVTDLGVCEAQNALAAAFPGTAFMGSPHQHVTDKGTHLNGNGYRWIGCQMGRAAGRVLAHRRDHWAPEPFEILQRGREILVSVQALEPVLEVRASYAFLVPTTLASLGFQLFDSAGTIGTASAALVSDRIVKVTANRDPVGVVTVRYAGNTGGGTGNVFAADPSGFPLNYLYTAGGGQYVAENIPALVGKPYPAATPLVAFSRAATII